MGTLTERVARGPLPIVVSMIGCILATLFVIAVAIGNLRWNASVSVTCRDLSPAVRQQLGQELNRSRDQFALKPETFADKPLDTNVSDARAMRLYRLRRSVPRELVDHSRHVRIRIESAIDGTSHRISVESADPARSQQLLDQLIQRAKSSIRVHPQTGPSGEWRPESYLKTTRRILEVELSQGQLDDPMALSSARFADDLASLNRSLRNSGNWHFNLVDEGIWDIKGGGGTMPAPASTEGLIRSLHRLDHLAASYAGNIAKFPPRTEFVWYLLDAIETVQRGARQAAETVDGQGHSIGVGTTEFSPTLSEHGGELVLVASSVLVALCLFMLRRRRDPVLWDNRDMARALELIRARDGAGTIATATSSATVMESVLHRIRTESGETKQAPRAGRVVCVYGTTVSAATGIAIRVAKSIAAGGRTVVSITESAGPHDMDRAVPIWTELHGSRFRIEELVSPSEVPGWWRFPAGTGGADPGFWGFPDGDPQVRRTLEIFQGRFDWIVVAVAPVMPGVALPRSPWAHRTLFAVSPGSARLSSLRRWLKSTTPDMTIGFVAVDYTDAEIETGEVPEWLPRLQESTSPTPIPSNSAGDTVLSILEGRSPISGDPA